ncbi:Inovirus Gp2 [compost metagenome]
MTKSAAALSSRQTSSVLSDERALSISLFCRETVDGKSRLRIPLGFQTAKHIEDIVDLTRDLLALRPSQCASGKSPVQRFGTLLDQRLQHALWLRPVQLEEHFPKHRLHPYVELFMRCAAKERLFDYGAHDKAMNLAQHKEYAAARQRMLAALRAGARKPALRKTVKAHQDKVRRNLSCIRSYTDAQFNRHSRLLVIRVDCMFVEGFAPAHDWTQARAYREALIKFLNRDLPKVIQSKRDRDAKKKPETIAGYVIGTEYGIETGWHFHVALLLNGDNHQNDVGIASRICWTWKNEIAVGYGRYYNCNLAAKEGRYGDKAGVGMVHRHDLAMREILNSVVTRYAVKGCYYAEAQTGSKDRLLNKGGWPKAKDPSRGGRPENRPSMQQGQITHVFSEKKRRFFPIRMPIEAPQPSVSC